MKTFTRLLNRVIRKVWEFLNNWKCSVDQWVNVFPQIVLWLILLVVIYLSERLSQSSVNRSSCTVNCNQISYFNYTFLHGFNSRINTCIKCRNDERCAFIGPKEASLNEFNKVENKSGASKFIFIFWIIGVKRQYISCNISSCLWDICGNPE